MRSETGFLSQKSHQCLASLAVTWCFCVLVVGWFPVSTAWLGARLTQMTVLGEFFYLKSAWIFACAFQFSSKTISGSCVLKASVGWVSVDTIGWFGDQHSADISTDTRPICWPSVGRVSVDMNRQACRPTPGRYFTATRPPLGRHSAATRPILYQHSANTKLTWSALGTEIFPALLREAFSGRRPFLAFNSGNIHVFFSSYVCSSSSLLYTTLVTLWCSSIWGLLLLEARYFRGAKDDIKSWYDCALFLPHRWVFQF